ncbi:unnamed protein product [Lactuca saligna]|uniref:Uncharacterized protein n=1 Tax=Lactuca saligna TaxID=75948 RepID=A0AA35Z749_LACSI|nr:unnamed protein product [Lactuca saligna]
MPLTSVVADALGVVTISLVTLLGLIGLLCILYSFYFRDHIRTQTHTQLGYFSGPWVIRIIFIFFSIFWGFSEILRLEFLRREGRVLHTLNSKWQERNTSSGPLSRKWNIKTTVYVLLGFLPLFALQMTVVFVGPRYETDLHLNEKGYFFKTTAGPEYENDVARCYYPLLSTIFLGLFATVLTVYLFWLGRRILILVINKGLQRRVYTLIFLVSSFFPLRVLLLGLSVLFKPGDAVFEVLAFLAFLSLLCCSGVGICVLVYFPIADSLALKNLQDIREHDTRSLIANCGPPDDFTTGSTKRGSISFRAIEREENMGGFVELSLFSPSQHLTPMGSPQVHGWPMLPLGSSL